MSTGPKKHPYLSGNYAPIQTTLASQPCQLSGTIPDEFFGGQYVRNGSNPLHDDDKRDLHWFDGDGMLTGVFFERGPNGSGVQPVFSNQYIVTDVYQAARKSPGIYPILPSVATFVDPHSSPFRVFRGAVRTAFLIFASLLRLVASPIKKVNSANTNVLYHDGRAMATCEIGPPIRVFLPSLQTVGWFTGGKVMGEPEDRDASQARFGGGGIQGFYKEMTTAHPRVDPHTGELLLFHSTFLPPFVNYSIVPEGASIRRKPCLNQAVPGLSSGKMMHDFGVSRNHTIILDLPLHLDPFNISRNKPVLGYDPHGSTRLGVFPRHEPEKVRWFTTDPCLIMHTANSWDEKREDGTHAHSLLCRMNGAAPLYHMGNVEAPVDVVPAEHQCRLYYFQLPPSKSPDQQITHQWALSAVPFEFPHVPRHLEMSFVKYIYGCSMRRGNFSSSSITSFKIDCLVKLDIEQLLQKGLNSPPPQITGCVDQRSMSEVLASTDDKDPIKVFALPDGWFAQECSFVPRVDGTSEDDGWLVTYVFDESQLDGTGNALETSHSELWVIDAIGMKDIVARVVLPQRVPYGMHGNWFSEEQILHQREVARFRSI
ncbi:hypothetical protein FE257_009470 [Aspergillus nanangensis]|uniref:Carotenoid oxygenase n=1 Tax=Aspergillus nanangensis TaxID=2582783 RepID=A0AAD4CKL1_ASPNN|nr:hypothetical protein FE257_009470 [Aspergillus nanangensis]